jgi:hypothetical protein
LRRRQSGAYALGRAAKMGVGGALISVNIALPWPVKRHEASPRHDLDALERERKRRAEGGGCGRAKGDSPEFVAGSVPLEFELPLPSMRSPSHHGGS